MPDVVMRACENLFIPYGSTQQLVFRKQVSDIAAHQLSCFDDEDNRVELTRDQIDPFLQLFDEATGNVHGPWIFLEIKGFAYADRMKNIDERLDCIAKRVKRLLPKELPENSRKVSVTFLRVEDRCWTVK